MNRLPRTDAWRGKVAPRPHPRSVRAGGICGSVTGGDGSRAQPEAAGVPQADGVHRIGASPVGGWWPTSSPSEGLYPPGGFSNFLQGNPFGNHRNANEDFHFVGAGMSQSSVSPIDMGVTRTPSPAEQTDDMVEDLDAEEDDIIKESRNDKRLNWSVPEDIRLTSAWLHNSKDPVDGNGRKADSYWADVTEEYNKTTETSRQRNRNQVKIRWDRCKNPLFDFHGCWVNASRV
uniref:Myb-like domain-containing protein n=1 Tax=Oryza brachyantha TaxID=4533 RepID=J3KUS2_ORYBR